MKWRDFSKEKSLCFLQMCIRDRDVDPENYYISADKEWILLSNDEENGTYQAVSVPAEMTQSVWKDKYKFLIA